MATDQKRDAILQAALRRFSHFGVAKTTMSEIAADLSISKPLLYYYFPDKMSLYAAVLGHIVQEGAEKQEKELQQEPDPILAIERYLEFRTDFILKFYQVLDFLRTFNPQSLPEPLQRVFEPIRKRELDRIVDIMERGMRSGRFKISKPVAAAELYYDFLEGFRQATIAQKPGFFPDKKQFTAILKREKEFSRIFLNGLTCDR